MRTIITHVGASLLDDKCEAFCDFGKRGILLGNLKGNHPVTHLQDEAADYLCNTLAELWSGADSERLRKSPAEIASLSLLELGAGDRVVLLYSDTRTGEFCAELIRRALSHQFELRNGYPYCPEVVAHKIDGLRVTELPGATMTTADSFIGVGLPRYVELVWGAYQELFQRWRDAREAGQEVDGILVFNVTAGYKGMIPIARDLAQLLNRYSECLGRALPTELCYLYEESSELIRYESLPLRFDKVAVSRPQLERAAGEDNPQHGGARDRQLWAEIPPEERRYYRPIEPDRIYVRLSPLGQVVLKLSTLIEHGTLFA